MPEYNEIKNEKKNQNWDELCSHVIPQPQSGIECFELFYYKYPPFNTNYIFILTFPMGFLSYTLCYPSPEPNTQSIIRPQHNRVQLQPQPTIDPQSRIITFKYPQPITIKYINLTTYI